ncbi:type II toxin-antitoxin system death-on-curing family toxin [Streptomyces showdoensis]|uniref:Fido domain-containing protein n=1 Tax=Streptomyces showdoensis TaxID=68268 RepID=A0A2P2GE76_STREW|nr:type II toxin-antitoxin system death-on-curing family toxin [Streptomyces showdoensis]KKZ69119.1 hypothetical protein VO63_35855 [Streptomyces showdoensis]
MEQVNLLVGDDVLDLADARGVGVEELVGLALRRYVEEEGESAYGEVYEQAAVLLHGIAANHPFVDGNKRAAWLSAAVFLAVNGIDLGDVDLDRAYALVIDVAGGEVDDVAVIADRLRGL